MKIVGLDLGDQWVGIALSDALQVSARPYKTIRAPELTTELRALLAQQRITCIVVGIPITLRGTASAQTVNIQKNIDELQQAFPDCQVISWDERLSSQRAQTQARATTKEEKIRSHAVAAAFILQTYLDYLDFQQKTL